MHAGLIHLAFNMMGLLSLGRELEMELGSVPFALLYIFSGLFGAPCDASASILTLLAPSQHVTCAIAARLPQSSRALAIATRHASCAIAARHTSCAIAPRPPHSPTAADGQSAPCLLLVRV
jgi:membrane associated rhomboid family serine protease